MGVTLRDIARKARVSVSTVSRVVNRKSEGARISRKTEKLILKTAAELNYRPNQLARSLRVRKTHTIGLIVPDISNPFFSHVIRSIQTRAHKLGYSLVVCDTDENVALEIEHIHLLVSKGVDGLIILPVGQKYHHLEAILKEHIPLVLVDRSFDALRASSVVVDNFMGAFEATEHLIANGHTHIGVVQGIPDTYTNIGRINGYKASLTGHGIPVDPRMIVGKDFRKENGYAATKALLKSAARPTAIFTTGDLITLGALQAIEEEGLRIPQDISIVAFDEIDFAPFLVCPLTTVGQPKDEMGTRAVELLIEQMKAPAKRPENRVVLKPRLIVRRSVLNLVKSDGQRPGRTGDAPYPREEITRNA